MNDLFSLAGKVSVVTGAVGLLGKEHCRALYDAGAFVAVCDVDENLAKGLAVELGPKAAGFGFNVTDKKSVEEGMGRILKTWDRLDVVVNNAGINDKFETPLLAAELSKLENYPEELWRSILDVNVTGTFLVSQVMGTHMAAHGGGSIINIGSTYGMVAPDQSLYKDEAGQQIFFKSAAYPASKGAVLALTRFLAAYWGSAGVRVNTLTPGGVESTQTPHFKKQYSNRTPLGRMAQPDDYRGALLFLASSASAYVTGSNVVIDGGWTVW